MAVNTLKEFLPILGFVLALVIVSMMVVSYFNVNMNETGGLRTLNRVAIHEGMTNGMESFVEGAENRKVYRANENDEGNHYWENNFDDDEYYNENADATGQA